MKKILFITISLIISIQAFGQNCNLIFEAKRHWIRATTAIENITSDADYQIAAEEFESALQYAPDCSDIYYNLALVYNEISAKQGEWALDKAEKYLRQYMSMVPVDEDAKSLLIKIEFKQEKYKKTQQSAEQKNITKLILNYHPLEKEDKITFTPIDLRNLQWTRGTNGQYQASLPFYIIEPIKHGCLFWLLILAQSNTIPFVWGIYTESEEGIGKSYKERTCSTNDKKLIIQSQETLKKEMIPGKYLLKLFVENNPAEIPVNQTKHKNEFETDIYSFGISLGASPKQILDDYISTLCKKEE
jgi:tetratricopeptide (TPR) repeat protein